MKRTRSNEGAAQFLASIAFSVSLFPRLDKPAGKQVDLTFQQLCEQLSTCDIRPTKDGPLISAAIYPKGKVYRKIENVLALSGFFADCDESHTLDELTAVIETLGACALIYSSFSHGTPDTINHPSAHAPGERYRVFFPFERPVSVKEWPDVWERGNLLFGGEIDPACKDVTRAFYTSSHPTGNGFVFCAFEGHLLRPNELPELPEDFYTPNYAQPAGDGGRPGDEYNARATNEDTAAILEAHGWTVTRSVSHRWKAKRPGKRGPGISATIGHYGPGVLHVFSSNAQPFETRRAYRPFGVKTLLDFNGDFRAAAKSLGKEGFGGFGSFADFPDENREKSASTGKKKENHAQSSSNQGGGNNHKAANPASSGGFGGSGSNPQFDKLPAPLGVTLRPVPKFQPELLPLPLRAFVMDAAERISCPPDFVAIPLVISLGSLIGRSVLIRPKQFDNWEVAPNLWGGAIGRPGSKKSPAASEGQRHLDRLQAMALAEFEEAGKRATLVNEINEAQRTAVKKKMAAAASKPGTTRTELEDISREAEALEDKAVTLKRYVVTDTTVESLGVILSQNSRGVLQSRDELTGWLNSLDKPGRETDKAFYLEAFNGTKQNFIYDRIGRGQTKIPHVCVSLFGTIQPGPLGQLIRAASEEKRQRDGFISRFQLLVYPDSIPYKRVDRYPDTEAKNRAFEVFFTLDNMTPETVGAQVDDYDDFPTPFLRFDDEAQELFNNWLDRLESILQSGKETTLLEEHFSKYRSLMPSLALIFHLVNVVDGESAPGPISLRATAQAAAWCEYLEAHARRIYGQAFNGDTEALERLGERLTELPNPFTARDIYKNKGWAGLTDKDEVERLLLLLHESHWVTGRNVPPDPQKGGRPTVRYWINPALYGDGKGGAA